jgi:hypothetical protein
MPCRMRDIGPVFYAGNLLFVWCGTLAGLTSSTRDRLNSGVQNNRRIMLICMRKNRMDGAILERRMTSDFPPRDERAPC